jgi:hypothetical protein
MSDVRTLKKQARFLMILTTLRGMLKKKGFSDSYEMDKRERCPCCRKIVNETDFFCMDCLKESTYITNFLDEDVNDNKLVFETLNIIIKHWNFVTKEIRTVAANYLKEFLIEKSKKDISNSMLENLIALTKYVLKYPLRKPHRKSPVIRKYDDVYKHFNSLRDKTLLNYKEKEKEFLLSMFKLIKSKTKIYVGLLNKNIFIAEVISYFFFKGYFHAEYRKKDTSKIYLDDSSDDDNDFDEKTGEPLEWEL